MRASRCGVPPWTTDSLTRPGYPDGDPTIREVVEARTSSRRLSVIEDVFGSRYH